MVDPLSWPLLDVPYRVPRRLLIYKCVPFISLPGSLTGSTVRSIDREMVERAPLGLTARFERLSSQEGVRSLPQKGVDVQRFRP